MNRTLALSVITILSIHSADQWRRRLPVGPAMAATNTLQQERVWYGHDLVNDWATAMTRENASALIDYLQEMTQDGYTIATWNGTAFDWPALARQSRRVDECRQLAPDHADMMYHVLCAGGFHLSSESAAVGMDERVTQLESRVTDTETNVSEMLSLIRSVHEITTNLSETVGNLTDTINEKLGHSASLTVFDALEALSHRLDRIEEKLS